MTSPLGRVEYTRLIECLDLGDDESDSRGSAVTGGDGPRWTPDDGTALRAAEPKREYISETRAAPPQTESLRTPQADLFE